MDLEARKYQLIQELFTVDERVLAVLERVIQLEKEGRLSLSEVNQQTLEARLKKYQEAPNETLNWEDVKNDW